MRLKIPLGWSLALCCGAALAQMPTSQEIAAPDTDADSEAVTSVDEIEVVIDATSEDYPQYAQAVRTALGPLYRKLRESAEPRDWMLASQLLPLSLADIDPEFSATRRAELLRNAAAAAPDDALVQWVAMTAMPGAGGGCAAPQTLPANLDAVLRLESDNGLAWLPVLGQAWQSKDALAIDSVLVRMAAATRYDDHSIEYAKLMIELFRNHPDTMRALGAASDVREAIDPVQYGLIMSQNQNTPLRGLVPICDRAAQPGADARRFAICIDLGQRLLREGRTAQISRIGDAVLMKASLSEDAGAVALRREIAWLFQALAEGDPVEQAHRYADAVQRYGSELEAVRELAKARGIPPTPPPAWQPSMLRAAYDGAAAPRDVEDAAADSDTEAED
ncbi:hypothetical protein ACFJIW_01805 [Tahibacter sp. UC22_41]|uniref:hypothetical protein n=1 Tax=Tahibacter sp. UC22_41 TaxID=3350178 RepID=UPI0036DB90C9